jgi:hypothetical protein
MPMGREPRWGETGSLHFAVNELDDLLYGIARLR